MARRTNQQNVDELVQALGLLIRRVRSAAAGYELSLSESAVLGRLERQGPATAAELARAEGMKPQSMGTTIASLEERGLLERKPHPTDGRQMMVALTPEGRALRQNVRNAKHTWLANSIEQLEKNDQETLFAALAIIRRLAEQP